VSTTRTIVVTTPAGVRALPELRQIGGIALIERPELSQATDPNVLSKGLHEAGAWATVAGSEPYTAEVFQAVPELRAILRWGTGSDAIDIAAATDAGVAVITTPGVNAEAVADMALALMLACIRRLRELDAAVRDGSWRLKEGPTRDLAGATVGVVGLGAIGRAVVRRLRGFGCHVIALEPNPDREFCAEYGVELAELDELLPRVDALTLHAPAIDSTWHLIGARELALLPRHAVVVNAARGSLLDQAALAEALTAGEIAGAGLDVFEHEPVAPEDPIMSAPNALLSGHISSYTELGLDRTSEAVIANLRDLLDGRVPAGCLNPQVLSRS
jgi:phosphoglycerate dehydrogenase-like enzyme